MAGAQNCIELKTILNSLFDWAKTNHVTFDHSKSELIHVEKSRQKSTDVISYSTERNRTETTRFS